MVVLQADAPCCHYPAPCTFAPATAAPAPSPAPAAGAGSPHPRARHIRTTGTGIVRRTPTPLFASAWQHAVRRRHELYTGSIGSENMGYLKPSTRPGLGFVVHRFYGIRNSAAMVLASFPRHCAKQNPWPAWSVRYCQQSLR